MILATLDSMKASCFLRLTILSTCVPSPLPFPLAKWRSPPLFPVPCAGVCMRLLLAVGPLLSHGNWNVYLQKKKIYIYIYISAIFANTHIHHFSRTHLFLLSLITLEKVQTLIKFSPPCLLVTAKLGVT